MAEFNKDNSEKIFSDDWRKSDISRKKPTYRNKLFVTNQSWLEGKSTDDEAEGLWRIHNMLYDLTSFIPKHPGGSYWLERTQGTDITELYETYHIKGISTSLLEKYKVREASQPRNYTLTMYENGFYKTLKKRIAEKVETLDYSPRRQTWLIHLGLLAATVLCSILSTLNLNMIFEILSGIFLCWLSIVAHNYFHQRDNWQMYTFNLTLMNFAEWRISHAISHHVYTNSLHDLEMTFFEPFLCWIPNEHFASRIRRLVSVLIQPLVYAVLFHGHFMQRAIRSIFVKNELFWHDIIGFTLPAIMLLFAKTSAAEVFLQWLRIVSAGSFLFGIISLNTSHHTPEIHHDGDAIRQDRDWGLYQLDTIIDLGDIKGSQFMVLTHFGEHILHHLFPSLDHGVLPQLYPVFLRTLEEFQGELRECSFLHHLIGQNQQLLRSKPNKKKEIFKN